MRGQIYDASGKPLVENVGKQVLTFTRDRKMTAQEMRETAGKLLQYVDVENPQVTERQEVDYYLANTKVYQEVVEHLPEKKKFDTDGNRLPEAKIYQAAVDSIDLQNSAIRMMRKRLSIFIAR